MCTYDPMCLCGKKAIIGFFQYLLGVGLPHRHIGS